MRKLLYSFTAITCHTLLIWKYTGEYSLKNLILSLVITAVLGGIGSIPGAMLGGFILGLSESFASAYLASEYKDLVAFSLLIVVLLIRPSGILGKPEVEKV